MWGNDKLKSDLRSTICKLVSYGVAFAMTTGMFIGGNVLKVQAKEYENTPKRKMIINTDLAADDAVAIMMAAADPNVEILGITVVAGNVSLEQAVDNTLMTLEVAGRPDIPVFKGADKPIDGKKMPTYSVFGTDGMGDKGLIHPTGKASEQSAKDFILSTLKMYPNEVEIVSLCPVTNIAECIKEDPETMRLVKRVWSMGSAGLGVGNATPVAEFNVYKDVAAYDIFLKEEIPTTIAGYDLCTD